MVRLTLRIELEAPRLLPGLCMDRVFFNGLTQNLPSLMFDTIILYDHTLEDIQQYRSDRGNEFSNTLHNSLLKWVTGARA